MTLLTLKDAKPGDLLRDTDGDQWLRTSAGVTARIAQAFCSPVHQFDIVDWPEIQLDEAEDNFGPFEFVRSVWDDR